MQWKQGAVICTVSYTSLLYDTTPIHCTPLPLHPPLMNTQGQSIIMIIIIFIMMMIIDLLLLQLLLIY